ncbi:MAG: hypothetical protein ISS78_01970 [Phycisphaerae bacterium]|nr:hypothetical protein [Phycisphaerae bacterium]
MRISREQYERVARHLDGEDIRLDGPERKLSGQIRRGEQLLAGLDVGPPARAMARARRRMIAALGRPGARLRWLGYVVGLESAAVAALLLVAVTLASISTGSVGCPGAVVVPTSVLVASAESRSQGDLDILASQLDELEAEILASLPVSGGDLEIELLERDIRDFLMTGDEDTWNEFPGG